MDDKCSKIFNAHKAKFGSQWLNVLPCKNLGLKLDDQQFRIRLGFRAKILNTSMLAQTFDKSSVQQFGATLFQPKCDFLLSDPLSAINLANSLASVNPATPIFLCYNCLRSFSRKYITFTLAILVFLFCLCFLSENTIQFWHKMFAPHTNNRGKLRKR